MVVTGTYNDGSSETIEDYTVSAMPKGNKKYTTAKSLKCSKSKVTLKRRKSYKLKVTEIAAEKKKRIQHHRNISYESSNTRIATVNSKGKISGKKKGRCKVYVFAQNGVYKVVNVKVQ